MSLFYHLSQGLFIYLFLLGEFPHSFLEPHTSCIWITVLTISPNMGGRNFYIAYLDGMIIVT